MKRKLQGHYFKVNTAGECVNAFVPAPLPPHPPINWTPELQGKFEDALLSLGRLDSVSGMLPDTSLLLYLYIRKEAVLSSMIEGTQSSLADLLLYESDLEPGVPLADVQEVSHYVAALNYGMSRLGAGFPISLRLIREIHGVLLSRGRGSHLTPGQFRRSQNWIGGTRPGNAVFVPPPADQVLECMGKLELFLQDQPTPTPALLKAALAHVQFETIHPFLDGNGRIGRLLITLLLCDQKILQQPLLYLSLYFKQHRKYYYELLNGVRLTGDWEAWLDFFAEAVLITATQALNSALQLHTLTQEDQQKISEIGRADRSTLLVHQAFTRHPIATAGSLGEKTGLTPATVNKCLRHLESLSIVRELTARKRNRVFSYSRYMDILNQGIELPQ